MPPLENARVYPICGVTLTPNGRGATPSGPEPGQKRGIFGHFSKSFSMAWPLLTITAEARETQMKKILATILSMIIIGMVAVPVGAQNPYRQSRERTYQTQRYETPRYDSRWQDNRTNWDNRTTWDSHRDKITTAAGAIGGAIIGGIIGGGKGAAIGALAGGGGAALYTYKIRDRYSYRRY
jgi:hypothetical protein